MHESSSSVLSSANTQPQHTHPRETPTDSPSWTPTHALGEKHKNLTLDAKTLRTDIQTLRDTIVAKTKETRNNPLLASLKLQLNRMMKSLKQVYKKQNRAHLLAHMNSESSLLLPLSTLPGNYYVSMRAMKPLPAPNCPRTCAPTSPQTKDVQKIVD